jgi:hypothetical protein
MKKKFSIYRVILSHLQRGERVWAGSMVYFTASNFDMNHCVRLAEKLGKKYPYFAERMFNNFGISPVIN